MTLTIVPIRSFQGMSRLAPVLDEGERRALIIRLASRVVATAAATGSEVAVVTADPEVAAWADGVATTTVPEPDAGSLDAAAGAGVAAAEGRPWVVVHADLPHLATGDIAAMFAVIDRGFALAPSYDGGTNAIGGSTPSFPFRFGTGSFRRHLAAVGGRATVVTRPGLAADIDRPKDVRRLWSIDATTGSSSR